MARNGYPAAIDGSLESFSRSTYLGADWGDFDGRTTDAVAELTHRFDNGGYGRIAVGGSRRATDYLYAFTARNVNSGATSLAYTARDLEQDTLAVDANYSQPFEWLGQVSEFVIGTDYKRYDTETADARGNLGPIDLASYRPTDIARPDIRFGTPTETKEREAGLYAKLTFRPIERLALVGGARGSAAMKARTAVPPAMSAKRATSPPTAAWCSTWMRSTRCTPATRGYSSHKANPVRTGASSTRAKAISTNWASRAATSAATSTPGSAPSS